MVTGVTEIPTLIELTSGIKTVYTGTGMTHETMLEVRGEIGEGRADCGSLFPRLS